jgi:malate synthase
MNLGFPNRRNLLKEDSVSQSELDASCINLAHDRDRCPAFVVTIMNIRVHYLKIQTVVRLTY